MEPAALDSVAFAFTGDANDVSTFSGTIYHALSAAKELELPVRGLKLDVTAPGCRRRRILWNVVQLLTKGRRGGYQYSNDFLERLWAQDPPESGETLVNFFQLYPRSVIEGHNGPKLFYIDQTLRQLFETYSEAKLLPEQFKAELIARETEQYQCATGVIAQSGWAATDVIESYGVKASRVSSVICGPNLSTATLARWDQEALPPSQKAYGSALRLVFVGKDFERKGLRRLTEALSIARASGANAELVVIGPEKSSLPEEIAFADGLQFEGFVDKRNEEFRFVNLVSSCDLGCLLSHAEAGGMSLLEFRRLGLPTIAPHVGGAPEYVVPEASKLFQPDAPVDQIADTIVELSSDPEMLHKMKMAAWSARLSATWQAAVTEIWSKFESA